MCFARGRRLILTLAVVLGVSPGAGAASQTPRSGAITGRVIDRATQLPVGGARVSIVGTTLGALTNDDGRYRLGSLGAGVYTVRVLRLGFESATQTATVVEGQVATLDFSLAASAVSLEQVTITATGEQIRTKETGNVVQSITPAPAILAATPSMTELLTARAPGVVVQQSSGVTGTASRIRIRGANSVSLVNEPLLVIDGVRANNDVGNREFASGGLNTDVGTGGQVTSRLNDINPEDIESIEVIKGPAGVALYGTAAANGVIQITTKRGRAGATQWRAYAEGRQNSLEYVDWPTNFWGIGGTGDDEFICNIDNVARRRCEQTRIASFNPLDTYGPFRVGHGRALGGSAAGGGERVTFFTSADYESDPGPFETNEAKRAALRANFRGQLRDNWDLSFNSGYTRSRVILPVNDNSTLGLVPVGLLGDAMDDPTTHGFFNGLTPEQLLNLNNRQSVERFITSAQSNFQATRWLSISGVTGLDYIDQLTQQAIQPGRVFFGDLPQGSATSNPFRIYNWTAQANAAASFDRGGARLTTTLGGQFAQERFQGTDAFGAVLTQGTNSLSGTSSRFAVAEFNTDNVTLGAFLQQQFAWRDRLFLTAAVRGDENSAFGKDFGWIYYPAFNASYVMSDEAWFPRVPALSSVRFRGAVGRSGQRPQFRNAITFYAPTAVRVDGEEVGALTFNGGGVGNLDLKPERTTEWEGGADLAFFTDRLTLAATYYTKTTRDALIQRPLPVSAGAATNRFENIGQMRNRGWEFQANASVLNTRPVKLDLTLNASTLDNEIVDLGSGIAPIVFNGGKQQHRNGYPAGGFWERPILSAADKNGDGLVSRVNCRNQPQVTGFGECEILLGDTAVYLGNPLPTREGQLGATVRLYDLVSFRVLVDHRGGFKSYNLTNRFRCVFVQNCRALNDPNAPLDDQTAAIAGLMGSDAGYMEDGTFTRLREASVTLNAPRSWARRLRASETSLTLAGRNLAVWTDYKGLDPEIQSAPGGNFTSLDFLTVPPTRQWTLRLNVSF